MTNIIWASAFLLGVFCLAGLIIGYTLDGFMNVMLVVTLFMVMAKIIQGKHPRFR